MSVAKFVLFRPDRLTVALVLGLLTAVVSAPAAPVAERDADAALLRTGKVFTGAARKAIPAVVNIRVEKTYRVPRGRRRQAPNDPYGYFGDEFLRRFFGPDAAGGGRGRSFTREGEGTGFLITKDGYILTNNHVVNDMDRITVRTHDGKEHPARIVGTDPHSEVALIKIDGGPFPFLELGDSDAAELGESVLAVGNPFGLTESVTAGIISAKGRSDVGIADYEDFLQTDAAINPGNSGGPLLTLDGRVVGINTAIVSDSGGSMGLGFAIPINQAKTVKDQLLATGHVTRGQLGVYLQPITPELAASFGLDEPQGVLLTEILPGSAAGKAGLQAGDIVTRLNDKPVESVGAFRTAISLTPPGTEITLTLYRERAYRTQRVRVGEARADVEAAPSAPPAAGGGEEWGLSVVAMPTDVAQQAGVTAGAGVLIERVAPDSAAALAGLEPGMLILRIGGAVAASPEAFVKALRATHGPVRLLIRDADGVVRFVVLASDRRK